MVIGTTSLAVYCCELCSQTTWFVRYYRRKNASEELERPDIHEALNIKLALIAGGGYPAKERHLGADVRSAVVARAQGRCQRCGAPGTQIDHVMGSSAEMDNLQLLCESCHLEKTNASLMKAPKEMVEVVHRPLIARSTLPARQPSDLVSWNHRAWVRGATQVGKAVASRWQKWLGGPGLEPISPAAAVGGFPTGLEPWSWYEEHAPQDSEGPIGPGVSVV
ncbi:MAG: HNH endonuclease signature motif containing protein [Acidimicrobiales bacterium]|jgi:hypothetical protein